MTRCGHTSSADVGHGFRSHASSQVETFGRLLAKIHLSDMGCCCRFVCVCFGYCCCLEGVLLSQLPGELVALPSGMQLRM